MEKQVEEKWVFITGTSGGIGRAVAEKFASEGICVYAHARCESEAHTLFLQELERKYGVLTRGVYFDLTDHDALRSELREIVKEKKDIQTIVNNAGVMHAGLFLMTDIDEIRHVFDVNFFAALEITQMLMKTMIRKKAGSIVNICSITGEDLGSGQCAYGVSKAALAAFTKTLAAEARNYGIRVNALAPGMTETRMTQQQGTAKAREAIEKGSSPFDRMALPEEIASAVWYLASDASAFVTGQILRVDGGIHLYD